MPRNVSEMANALYYCQGAKERMKRQDAKIVSIAEEGTANIAVILCPNFARRKLPYRRGVPSTNGKRICKSKSGFPHP